MHELTRRHDTHNMHGALARTPRRAHEHGRYEAEEPNTTGAHGPIVYVAAASQSWRVDTSIPVELYEEVQEMLLKNGLCYRPSLYTLAGNVILFYVFFFTKNVYAHINARRAHSLLYSKMHNSR